MDGQRPDVVYLVRSGDSNEELRFSLRSVAANIPHRRVFIAGFKPRWVRGVVHVPVRQNTDKWRNQERNLAAAAARDDLADEVVLFNDDFFVTEPVDRVPAMHGGPLRRVVERKRGRHSRYLSRLQATLDLLGADALTFDQIHTPLPMRRDLLAEVMGEVDGRGLLFRSVYGNRHLPDAVQVGDAKARGKVDVGGDPFVSTSDRVFDRGAAGRRIRRLFPDPCVYEADR